MEDCLRAEENFWWIGIIFCRSCRPLFIIEVVCYVNAPGYGVSAPFWFVSRKYWCSLRVSRELSLIKLRSHFGLLIRKTYSNVRFCSRF